VQVETAINRRKPGFHVHSPAPEAAVATMSQAAREPRLSRMTPLDISTVSPQFKHQPEGSIPPAKEIHTAGQEAPGAREEHP
jgi:hypothetical protein